MPPGWNATVENAFHPILGFASSWRSTWCQVCIVCVYVCHSMHSQPFSLIICDHITFILGLVFAKFLEYEEWIRSTGFRFALTRSKVVISPPPPEKNVTVRPLSVTRKSIPKILLKIALEIRVFLFAIYRAELSCCSDFNKVHFIGYSRLLRELWQSGQNDGLVRRRPRFRGYLPTELYST